MPDVETNELLFFVNGEEHCVKADPEMLLVDYLRSRSVSLTGTKDPCRQGGCGSCTVTQSWFDGIEERILHKAINSCLTPLCAIDGMHITTVEGLGQVGHSISKEQFEIGISNGTQCGYCTPGFVMALHSHLRENPDATRKEIEENFDGNICRCTGFRPLLFAAKNLASDGNKLEQKQTPVCIVDPSLDIKVNQAPPKLPPSLNSPVRPIDVQKGKHRWIRPLTIEALRKTLNQFSPADVRLVAGNTSSGIPGLKASSLAAVQIDISMIADLHRIDHDKGKLTIGSGVTYHTLIKYLDAHAAGIGAVAGLLHYMARRTAGAIVRHRATIAGNMMLVLQNSTEGGTPFPSDLFTILFAFNSEITFYKSDSLQTLSARELVSKSLSDEGFLLNIIIVDISVPLLDKLGQMEVYKTALREVNSHSIVNAVLTCSIETHDGEPFFSAVQLCFGALGVTPQLATSTADMLVGKQLTNTTVEEALLALDVEVNEILVNNPSWLSNLPDEGSTPGYKVNLAKGFLRKFLLSQINKFNPQKMPPRSDLAFVRTERPVSIGSQLYQKPSEGKYLGQPYIKNSAFEQATGEIIYVQDIALPHRGVQGAMIISQCARGEFEFCMHQNDKEGCTVDELDEHLKREHKDFIKLFTARDIPGDKKPSDPWFSLGQVTYYGQPIGMIVAKDKDSAEDISTKVMAKHIRYIKIKKPILTTKDAREKGSFFVQKHDDNQTIESAEYAANNDWVGGSGDTQIGNENCLVLHGSQSTGAQKHFYMESQSCLVYPGEGRRLMCNVSTQMPRGTQSHIAQALNILESEVTVHTDRVGGAYGGKCARTSYVAVPAAVAAYVLQRPVKITLNRDIDSSMIGNRHPFTGEYSIVAIREGEDKGKILGCSSRFFSNGGNTVDCSFDVMDCAILGSDGAYNIPYFHTEGHVCKTNISSSTSMRSYGSMQAQLIQEDAVEAMAHSLKMDAAVLRRNNFYTTDDKTPYGQKLSYCLMAEVWDRLLETSNYLQRKVGIDNFNKANRWTKRGIHMMPVKYGMGYNLGWLMQGGALININALDGSVLVEHGGVEMGQGIRIKMAQLAADELNIPMELIVTTAEDTRQVPNPITTGATSSSDTAGWAVKEACRQQCERMEELGKKLLKEYGEEKCALKGLNFWKYESGWNTEVTTGTGEKKVTNIIWKNLTNEALMHRVNLSSQAVVPSPGLVDGEDQQFYGFTYSAACVEVEIDVLTGETTIRQSDVIYDIGESLNPAIDIGQVEGAYVMGLGYVLTEEMSWQKTGDEIGRLNTLNTWTYKPPAYTTIPVKFNVDLFPRDTAPEIPINPNLLNSSKGIGEPPLVLASGAFFAIKQAVLSAREDAGLGDGWFEMPVPATVQVVQLACAGEKLPEPM